MEKRSWNRVFEIVLWIPPNKWGKIVLVGCSPIKRSKKYFTSASGRRRLFILFKELWPVFLPIFREYFGSDHCPMTVTIFKRSQYKNVTFICLSVPLCLKLWGIDVTGLSSISYYSSHLYLLLTVHFKSSTSLIWDQYPVRSPMILIHTYTEDRL